MAIAGITLGLYWPATRHDFINFDDDVYVTANSHVQGGLTASGISWAFGHAVTGNWHPLTMLSLMLDYQLHGMRPWGYHLTNLALHSLNTSLVFLLLRQLTGATWRSALVAALFGWHPVNVESVAWISERKNVLSFFWGLLALVCYTLYCEGRKDGAPGPGKMVSWYGAALACLALGLMSKPVLVTWPVVMLLLDYWPLDRFPRVPLRALIREKAPFFALAAALCLVTIWAHRREGDLMALAGLSLGGRVANALVAYARYLGALFWPAKLAIFYPLPPHWPWEETILAGLILTGISLLLLTHRSRHGYLLMGWCWFVITLVPVIGLVQVGSQAMADRHEYIPGIGIWIAVVWGSAEFCGRWRAASASLPAAGLAALAACLILTRQQLGCWQDSETLFRHTLRVTENNYVAHGNLGAALLDEGRKNEAIDELRQAIRLYPGDAKVHNSLGVAFMRGGDMKTAADEFGNAIALQPNSEEAHYNLGLVMFNDGKTGGAIKEFQTALRLDPDDSDAHNKLGLALAAQGGNDMAINEYTEAIRLRPNFAEAHYNLGTCLLNFGRVEPAMVEFQTAIQIKPDYAPPHNNLGIALTRIGQVDAAIGEFKEALRLDPDYTKAQNNLAKVLALKEKTSGQTALPPK